MKRVFLIVLAVTAAVFAAVAAVHYGLDRELHAFYGDKLRGSFFGGFLSLGGFLFSLKTFIVIKMKEGLYDHEGYRQRFQKTKSVRRSDETLFSPLRRLSRLLFWSIIFALGTAVAQVTIGLIPRWWSVAVCLSLAGGTLTLLSISLWQIKRNLDAWFEVLEEEAAKSGQ